MDGKAAAGMPPTLAAAAAGAGGVPSTGGSASGGAWCSKWGYRLYTRCMMRRPMAVVFNCTECGKMASVKCNAGESRETSKRVRDHMKGIHQFITNSTTEKFSQSKDPPTQKDPTESK
jgi:predicted small metal-binding protein